MSRSPRGSSFTTSSGRSAGRAPVWALPRAHRIREMSGMTTRVVLRTALAALLLLAGAAAGAGAAAFRDAATYAGRIYPGVAVTGIAVGGLSREDATRALAPAVDRR